MKLENRPLSPEMPSSYPIRPMDKEDLEQVNEIDRQAFPTQWPPANYRQELQNKIAHYLVACDCTRTFMPAAAQEKERSRFFAWLSPWKKEPENQAAPPEQQIYIVGFSGIWMLADEAHITNIAVRQEYRGRRVGEHMLLATVDLARELKASFLTLEVRVSNFIAQGLYNKFGFMQTGLRRGYYLDNHEDAIIMSTEPLNSETYCGLIESLRESLRHNPER